MALSNDELKTIESALEIVQRELTPEEKTAADYGIYKGNPWYCALVTFDNFNIGYDGAMTSRAVKRMEIDGLICKSPSGYVRFTALGHRILREAV